MNGEEQDTKATQIASDGLYWETVSTFASAETVLASDSRSSVEPKAPSSCPLVAAAGRSTVLPRVSLVGDRPSLVNEAVARYEEKKLLGAGGMGEVIAARDHDIERDVAIKRLLPELRETAALARFVDEIRTVGKLEHPNIVPIHDVGIDDKGRYFFVMKHVKGETLEDIIAKLASGDRFYHATYTFERRAQIFLGILEAVHYAHEQGILHRDIKPANVMVGPYGEVVLMDWGIAKRMGGAELASSGPAAGASDAVEQGVGASVPVHAASASKASKDTAVGTLLGTPAYMSPEQARGENDTLDVRSDIYSLCVLLWELLTLRHYLDGRTSVSAMLAGVVGAPAPHPSRFSHPIQGKVPADLAWFALGGLAKDPNERYRSVSEMIGRLQARNDGQIPIQCPLTLAKRAMSISGHFLDRHPLAGLVGMLLLVLGGLTTLVWGAIHALG